MSGNGERGDNLAICAAPGHVRVSVVGGRTQLDVALPVDVPMAGLVPQLVELVRSRDVEVLAETPWAATRDTFWVLSRLDPRIGLRPDETLRAAGVADGELLRLTDECALRAPTLYDDVVDAAAQLNKAAYAGWNAAAARWMSFAGLGVASLVWVYLLVNVGVGPRRAIMVGLAVVVAVMVVGVAALAHRAYGQADVGAGVGWCTIPISAAIVWVLVRGFGGYAVAAGCGLLVVLNAFWYWVVGTGRWGYLASGVFFAGGGLAMLGYALGVGAQAMGVVLAVAGAFGCLIVPWLTAGLARCEPGIDRPDADPDTWVLEDPFKAQPSGGSGVKAGSSVTVPTAEAVWARVGVAAVTRSALYAGLAVSVLCGVVAVLRVERELHWAALAFAGVCAVALGVRARQLDSAVEGVSLDVAAVGLVVVGAVCAQGGTVAMAWAGFGTVLTVALVASVAGLRVGSADSLHGWAPAWAYLQYGAYLALSPVALWSAGVYTSQEIL